MRPSFSFFAWTFNDSPFALLFLHFETSFMPGVVLPSASPLRDHRKSRRETSSINGPCSPLGDFPPFKCRPCSSSQLLFSLRPSRASFSNGALGTVSLAIFLLSQEMHDRMEIFPVCRVKLEQFAFSPSFFSLSCRACHSLGGL